MIGESHRKVYIYMLLYLVEIELEIFMTRESHGNVYIYMLLWNITKNSNRYRTITH